MKNLFKLLMLAVVATLSLACKNGTECRCVFNSPIAGRQEFSVEEKNVLKVAKSCAGYESYLNETATDFEYRCYND